MTLWNNYKRILFEKFDLEEQNTWADWKEKDANLVAKTYTDEHRQPQTDKDRQRQTHQTPINRPYLAL